MQSEEQDSPAAHLPGGKKDPGLTRPDRAATPPRPRPLIARAEDRPGRAPGPVKWSWNRWFCTIALVFAVKVGLILYLEKPIEATATPPRFQTRIVLAADPLSEQTLSALPDLQDPTVFALPGHDGFSGKAWLRFERPKQSLEAWHEPRRWLALDPAGLGNAFQHLVNSNTPPRFRPVGRTTPGLTGVEIYVPAESIPTQSTLRVEGILATRERLGEVQLPSWPHHDLLTDSVVHVVVDAAGYTISATVLEESGLAQADLHALEQARQTRFRRLPPAQSTDELDWGRLVFRWHTTSTNSLRTAPAP